MAKAKLVAVSTPSNDGKHSIDMSVPYAVHLTIQGTSDLLFHRKQTLLKTQWQKRLTI